ncbi:MAG TPA: energy transducer TonB [Edaphobacter sp.]|nr:energy transducer TonB [Edaphobacter sp.]
MDEKENHDQAVKRFRSLCDMHRIPCGETGSLRQFLTALKEDRHFAMDFWAMVGELSERERGTLSDEEMLSVIVAGSAGKTIAELPLVDKVATAELKNMLAGVDVDAPIVDETVIETTPEAVAAVSAVKEKPAEPLGRQGEGDPSRVDISQTKLSVEDALRRLEETSRELRDQLAALAAIDQLKREAAPAEPRVPVMQGTEMELSTQDDVVAVSEPRGPVTGVVMPALEEPESVATTPPHEFEPLDAVEPVLTPRRALRRVDERRSSAAPQFSTLSHRGFLPPDTDDDPTIPVPLAEYAEANSSRVGVGTIILIVLVCVLVAAGFALHEGYGREQLEHAKAALLTKVGLFGAELHDAASPAPSSTADKAQPSVVTGDRSTVPQAVANNRSQETPAQPKQDSETPRQNAPQPRPESDGSLRAGARPESMPIEPGAVRVAPSVMQANLLSSRVAVYPESARVRGIQGPVEVEAVISRSGNVEYAHAVSGDPRLRAAAEDAVLKWKFKPYLVNGTAVQAVTQVRINFRLR